MHVPRAAHRRRVAEERRDLADHAREIALPCRRRPTRRTRPQGDQRLQRAGPRAEQFRRAAGTRELRQVAVHVGGIDAAAPAGLVLVLEQELAGQVLAGLHDPRDAPVADLHAMQLAALAAELELEARAGDADVAVAHRREAERPVRARVLLVADPHERRLEQPHERREDLLARHAGEREVASHPPAQRRERAREVDQLVVLRLVADLAPARVVAVLLAPPRVTSDGLDVAAGRRADAHVRPRRRDRECADSFEIGASAQGTAGGPAVAEPPSRPHPPDGGSLIRDVAQPRAARVGRGLGREPAVRQGRQAQTRFLRTDVVLVVLTLTTSPRAGSYSVRRRHDSSA